MPSFKTFLSPGGPHVGASFGYLWDPLLLVSGALTNEVIGTGGFRPLFSTDLTTANVNIGDIEVAVDELEGMTASGVRFQAAISGQSAGYSAVSTSAISGSMGSITTGIALQSTPGRKEAYTQVVGSGGPLYLLFGTAAASATNFNVLLKAASTDGGADGGIWSSERYKGPVSCSGYIGCRFTIWQDA